MNEKIFYVLVSMRIMQRAVGTVLVAALVVLAGCSGVLGGGGSNDVETVTPAPVPTDEPTPTPVPQLAPGVTGQGIENPSALVAASESFFENQTFTARLNFTRVASNGSVLARSLGTLRAGPAGEGYRYVSERNGGSALTNTSTDPVRTEVWWDGERFFVKSTYSNGTTAYRRLPVDDGQTGYGFAIGGLPGTLESLGTNDTVVAEQLIRNGTTLYRVRGTSQTEFRRNVSFQFLVDSRGVIHEYRTVRQVTFRENAFRIVIETQFSEIGATEAPERPSWIDEALNQTTPIAEETTTTNR
jgi:hypothetical protein